MELSGEGVDLADMEYVVINQGKDASSATLAGKEKGMFINDIDIEPGKIWTVDYNSSTKGLAFGVQPYMRYQSPSSMGYPF
ncbi:hypothetical protein EMWEY_00040100 [Eimeria maxima]|uniref:Uncharacterized protein n=1 Tax=Eimeria maxima TaxID=5804 RepID=U6MBD7_EIMMA|nr:hypothetical protein EMWEY_00040100 [Eimeria maxima]CDJ61346.1 hypothetical protein EMWEY_00040100 [Eimeria maxima]